MSSSGQPHGEPEREHVFRALTVAGSDSGGGAGIQADLKTMHQFGVFGMSVLTAVTAQNTKGVQGIHELPPLFVVQQLESIYEDLGADAVKTGMLSSEQIIREVASYFKTTSVKNLVVDPVMVAKGGAPLLSEGASGALMNRLLPLALVVTPNVPEAEVLCGYEIRDFETCHQACVDIAAYGSKSVVLKGGHAAWPDIPEAFAKAGVDRNFVVDVIYTNGTWTYFAAPRTDSRNTHGTGCTFSSGITSMLAKGASILESIAVAKAFVSDAIERSKYWDVGHGHGPTDHAAPVRTVPAIHQGQLYVYLDATWSEHVVR